jgi:hypothetical protein
VFGEQQSGRIPISAHRRIRQRATLPRFNGGTTRAQGDNDRNGRQRHPTRTGRTGWLKGEKIFEVHI